MQRYNETTTATTCISTNAYLKVILAEKKKSNLWLSKELGCSPTTVSKWCTNSSQPPLEMLMKIIRLLDVDLKDLVRFEELDKNDY